MQRRVFNQRVHLQQRKRPDMSDSRRKRDRDGAQKRPRNVLGHNSSHVHAHFDVDFSRSCRFLRPKMAATHEIFRPRKTE